MKSFGLSFKRLKISDLVLVNEAGEIDPNKAADTAIHKARPDVFLYHLWENSAMGRHLSITQDACIFYQDHGLFNDYTGVVGETSEGDRIALALEDKKAVILQNHGLLTVEAQYRRMRFLVYHHGTKLSISTFGRSYGEGISSY